MQHSTFSRAGRFRPACVPAAAALLAAAAVSPGLPAAAAARLAGPLPAALAGPGPALPAAWRDLDGIPPSPGEPSLPPPGVAGDPYPGDGADPTGPRIGDLPVSDGDDLVMPMADAAAAAAGRGAAARPIAGGAEGDDGCSPLPGRAGHLPCR